MRIADTKVCPKCGKEYPSAEFHSQHRNGCTTYHWCKACRQVAYQKHWDDKKIKTQDMPWYDWWPLKQTAF